MPTASTNIGNNACYESEKNDQTFEIEISKKCKRTVNNKFSVHCWKLTNDDACDAIGSLFLKKLHFVLKNQK